MDAVRACWLDAVACHDSLKAFVCQLPAAFRAINVGALLQQLWGGGGRERHSDRERERALHNELRDLLGGLLHLWSCFSVATEEHFFSAALILKSTLTHLINVTSRLPQTLLPLLPLLPPLSRSLSLYSYPCPC